MVELLNYIDCQIKDCIPEAKQFGLCHLVETDNEKIPCTVEERATKVIPDTRYNVMIYHRLLNGSPVGSDDLSFGKRTRILNTQRIRTVVFVKLSLSDSLIDDIINALPDLFNSDGYDFANVSKNISLIRDRLAIWTEEYSNAYKDKFQMKYRLYALEYDLEYVKCACCV